MQRMIMKEKVAAKILQTHYITVCFDSSGVVPDVGVAKSRATTLLAAHFKQSVAVYVGESGEGRTVGVLTEHLHHTSSRDDLKSKFERVDANCRKPTRVFKIK
jgi:hypothetical protein